MTYLKRSNVTGRKSRTKTIGIIFGLIALFTIHFIFPTFFPAMLYPITSVFWKSESSSLGFFARMGKIVQSKYSLVKENKRLSNEIASRDASMLILDTLRTENEELKKQLGRTGQGKDILGVILSRPPVSPYDTLVIDIGTSDGVALGNRVYTAGDTLVGDVVETYEHFSKVSLFSTPGRAVPILVGSSTIATQAIGKGGGNFSAKIPADIKIHKGDTIITTQIRSHGFGVVQEILIDSSDSLQTILFKTPININEFRFVEVDTSAK